MMPARKSWTDIYRSHTCFKAMHRALELRQERNIQHVQIDSRLLPCKMCRAWWRRAGRFGGVSATFTAGGKEWRSDSNDP
jgi:hypothetical protein